LRGLSEPETLAFLSATAQTDVVDTILPCLDKSLEDFADVSD
jgi:hypothetical protein